MSVCASMFFDGLCFFFLFSHLYFNRNLHFNEITWSYKGYSYTCFPLTYGNEHVSNLRSSIHALLYVFQLIILTTQFLFLLQTNHPLLPLTETASCLVRIFFSWEKCCFVWFNIFHELKSTESLFYMSFQTVTSRLRVTDLCSSLGFRLSWRSFVRFGGARLRVRLGGLRLSCRLSSRRIGAGWDVFCNVVIGAEVGVRAGWDVSIWTRGYDNIGAREGIRAGRVC